MTINLRIIMILIITIASYLPFNLIARDGDQRYIYDAVSADDHRAVVINLDKKTVSIQDKSDAAASDYLSMESGEFVDCGNKYYFCVKGPLNVAIPKTNIGKKWAFAGIFCRSSLGRHGDVYQITCISSAQKIETILIYSASHGILSFKNTPIGGYTLYKLRGDRGLF